MYLEIKNVSKRYGDQQALIDISFSLKKGDIVIYESTVYPGATEQDCVPVLKQISGLEAGSSGA